MLSFDPTLIRRWRLAVPFLGLAVLAGILLAVRYWPRAPLADAFATSRAIYDVNGRLLRLTLAADDKYRLWTPLSAISPTLAEAVLLHEDGFFYRHPGVDPVALLRAGLRTYGGGARQGGSTITMQLARLMYRLDTRSPWGKAKQIALALELEAKYSKAQILEAYLN
ncbi:MAG: transglycosylase domain-containing protein, partial [Betaproteobacteria bacterium]